MAATSPQARPPASAQEIVYSTPIPGTATTNKEAMANFTSDGVDVAIRYGRR